jgi:hypothetical protein
MLICKLAYMLYETPPPIQANGEVGGQRISVIYHKAEIKVEILDSANLKLRENIFKISRIGISEHIVGICSYSHLFFSLQSSRQP